MQGKVIEAAGAFKRRVCRFSSAAKDVVTVTGDSVRHDHFLGIAGAAADEYKITPMMPGGPPELEAKRRAKKAMKVLPPSDAAFETA